MKKISTAIFAALIALALSMPAWAQAGGTTTPATKSAKQDTKDTKKDGKDTKDSKKKKGGKKKSDTKKDTPPAK
jgi:hypothetical protein